MCGFAKAVDHLKAGHAAARAGWQEYIYLDDNSDEGFAMRNRLPLRYGGQAFFYRPTPADIRADDWVFFRREDADAIIAKGPVVHTP